MLQIEVLGKFEAIADGNVKLSFKTEKERAMLAYLVLHHDVAVRRSTLASLLWSDSDERAALANLRKSLHRLRKSLGASANTLFLPATRSIQLNSAEFISSVHQFETLLNTTEQHAHNSVSHCETCLDALRQACSLYQGELLAGVMLSNAESFVEWLLIERERLHQRALIAFHHLTEAELARGDFVAAQRAAQRQLALEPWRESAYGQLMIALACQGQIQAAFKQFDQCRAVLDEELGIAPSAELRSILSDIHDNKYAPAIASPSRTPQQHRQGNLQAASSPILGRTDELVSIIDLLANPEARLITMLGAGGIGKSSLAQAVGLQVQASYPDGVWFVSFVANHAGELASTIADTLGITIHDKAREGQQLADTLREKRLLLILDNFEDVLDDALDVAELLSATKHLKLICTSREPLELREEWLFPLGGLTLPPMESTVSAESLTQFSSAQLFVQRAKQAAPAFHLNDENAFAIANICHFVNGSPLGIELAAAWIRRQTPSELLATMFESPDVLHTKRRDVPMRQRSMRRIFQYSFDGLEPEQQTLLSQLSLFSGPLSAEQVKAIMGAPRFELAELVDKSLLQIDGATYRMHPLMRQFSAEMLSDSDPIITAFSHHFLSWTAQQFTSFIGADSQQAAVKFTLNYENVLRAWHIALGQSDLSALLHAHEALVNFWIRRGRLGEGIEHFESTISSLHAQSADPSKVAILQARQAGMLVMVDRYDEGLAVAQTALDHIDPAQAGWAWLFLGVGNWQIGKREQARDIYKHAVTAFQADANDHGLGRTLVFVGIGFMQFQELDSAHQQYLDALACGRKAGDALCEIDALVRLGILTLRKKALTEARYWLEKAQALCARCNDMYFNAVVHNVLSELAIAEGKFAEAEQSLRKAERFNRRVGVPINSMFTNLYLGITLRNLARYDESEQVLNEALRIVHQLGHRWWESEILFNLAKLMLATERPALARQFAQRSIDTATERNNTLILADATSLLATIT